MADVLRPFADPDTPRLMVFGHPAHELALFGLLQRYRSQIVILTDGDGVEQRGYSKKGLGGLGLLGSTRYLSFAEGDFYAALLARDSGFFVQVAERLGEVMAEVRPVQVFCDAVELYNPVHDVTLPIVRRALLGQSFPPPVIYEVPLVYQADVEGEVYRIQRVPEALADRRVVVHLTEAEIDSKDVARHEIYLNLHGQAGGDFLGQPRESFSREEVSLVLDELPMPGDHGRKMRYEWRARLLQEQGDIARVITYADHFRPVVDQLMAG